MAKVSDEIDCGSKHLKLLVIMAGIILSCCGSTIGYAMNAVAQIDARVRIVEQDEAANAARFEAIQASLTRLERMK